MILITRNQEYQAVETNLSIRYNFQNSQNILYNYNCIKSNLLFINHKNVLDKSKMVDHYFYLNLGMIYNQFMNIHIKHNLYCIISNHILKDLYQNNIYLYKNIFLQLLNFYINLNKINNFLYYFNITNIIFHILHIHNQLQYNHYLQGIYNLQIYLDPKYNFIYIYITHSHYLILYFDHNNILNINLEYLMDNFYRYQYINLNNKYK